MTRRPHVAVVGAGAAGMAAALAAARRGATVTLLDQRPRIGGTVAHALIHTIGGLYDSAGLVANEGLPAELEERLLAGAPLARKRQMGRVWVLNVTPALYARTLEAWIAEERNIRLRLSATAVSATLSGRTVSAIQFTQGGETTVVDVDALVDCTGDAVVIGAAAPECVRRHTTQALAGLVFTMRGVRPDALVFPRNLAVQRRVRAAVDAGALPPECSTVWIDSGVEDDEVYVKLSIVGAHAGTAIDDLAAFLPQLPGFEHAALADRGELTYRNGVRLEGDYLLTADDVRSLARFDDAVGRCAWPIEFWNPEKGVQLEYLPGNGSYDIPLRSLKARGLENAWAAGRCLSADDLAQASARVAGTCWAMGQAAGAAATGAYQGTHAATT